MPTQKKPIQSPANQAAVDAAVRIALNSIEHGAQSALGRAMEALSPIRGLSPECSAVAAEYRRVRKLWYRLSAAAARKRLELDHEPTPECRDPWCVGALISLRPPVPVNDD